MNFLQKILSKPKKDNLVLPKDFDARFTAIYEKSAPYTMTSPERMYALYKAVQYIVVNELGGDIVECGVWRGGSSMVSALALLDLDAQARKIYLYDTFKGMSKPGEEDNPDVMEKWQKSDNPSFNDWCYASLEEVKKNMFSTGYPRDKIIFVEGEVEKTMPSQSPAEISLLRLDTDWYESTYHELTHLYPLLSKGGVLIIDDYGHHEGARRAVDRYFADNKLYPYLARIDGTGRVIIKN